MKIRKVLTALSFFNLYLILAECCQTYLKKKTVIRRSLFLPNYNNPLKVALAATTPYKFLYGSDPVEKFKSAKLIDCTSNDFEPVRTKPQSVPKNPKSLPRYHIKNPWTWSRQKT